MTDDPVVLSKSVAVTQLYHDVKNWMREWFPVINTMLKSFNAGSVRIISGRDLRMQDLSHDGRDSVIREVIKRYSDKEWKVSFTPRGETDDSGWFTFS
jgi:hypothetical protein